MNKRRRTIRLYLGIVTISFLNLAVNAEPKEKIITVCTSIKSAVLRINTNFSEEEKKQPAFEINEKLSDEKYTLSKLITVANDEDRLLFF
jgi:nitrogen regulatory protein PII-like uncharacterized protein